MAKAGKTTEELEDEELNRYARLNEKRSRADIASELRAKLNAWKNVELRIGIIGYAGVGKSTFINAMRGMKPKDVGYAKSGSLETTKTPTPYCYPNNPNVKLWDLPGVGTTSFPRATYLKKIDFDMYDFFLIMCSERFTEDDLWFAREIRDKNKRFYFVRTKIDQDLHNGPDDYEDFNEQSLKDKLRNECKVNLEKAGFHGPDIFLICKNPALHDFPELQRKLASALPELKREAALLTLRCTSKPMIHEKAESLRGRVGWVAFGSGLAGLQPIPGLSFGIDAGIINSELTIYKESLSLDTEGIRNISQQSNVPEFKLTDAISHNAWFNCAAVDVLKYCHSLGIATAVKESLKAIPILGSIVGGITSCVVTSKLLHWSINSMEETALAVVDMAFSEACSKEILKQASG